MPISMGIFKVEKFELDKIFEKKKEIKIFQDGKTSLNDFLENDLPSAETTIRLKSNNEDKTVFEVTHYTNTIERPIRTWTTHLYTDSGYQERYDFEIIYDKKECELYAFTNIDVIKQLVKRFGFIKNSIKIRKYVFNLDFEKIAEILNIYGIWKKVEESNIKCEAKFGSNVINTERPQKNTIAINMKIKLENDNIIDITLSKDGQISSPSGKASREDLIWFYKKIKEDLLRENE